MPFPVSFCLTNIGNLPSNTTLSFYSNVDGYTVPIQTTVPLFSVTGANCPFTLNGVYDNTQTIKVESSIGNCCAVVNVLPNDPCTFCNLGFDVYSSTTLSRIVAGNLTGSCDNNITDYLIEWYNITDLNTVVYTSGKGVLFLPYGYPHPLVGITSIPALSGTYIPIIKKVRLNGINYSSELESGFVQATLDCFTNTTVSVSPLTCNNGTNIGNYTHLVQFSGTSQGQPPPSIPSTFILSPNTNYVAWQFNAFSVQDTIKITYYGSYYNNTPIILEYWNVGHNNTSSNFSTNLNPKTVKTFPGSTSSGFKKVTCLTGLTRSVNDYLVLEIIPNQFNPSTDFQLSFICLEDYDCSICYGNYLNTPYKIITNSITANTGNCNTAYIAYKISGCSTSDISNSDFYKYTYSFFSSIATYSAPAYPNGEALLFANYYSSVICNNGSNPIQAVCSYPNTNLITFKKDNSGVGGIGNVLMKFSDINDLEDFYTTYYQRLNSIGPVTDPTQLRYYSYVTLTVPVLSQNPTVAFTGQCGDTTSFKQYLFHTSSVVTTGITGSEYFMNLTMPTITKQINFTTCELYCNSSVELNVSLINFDSTGTTNNVSWINGRGNRITVPFNAAQSVGYNAQSKTYDESRGFWQNSSFLNKTLPMSGSNFTLIPSLSSVTCNLLGKYTPSTPGPDNNNDFYKQDLYWYRVDLTPPYITLNFKISAIRIINGVASGPYIKIYEMQNGVGTILDPSYFI
jgi:hypothetical protein